MRKILVSTLLCLFASMPAAVQSAGGPFDLVTFQSRLTPSNEVPPLTGVDASGNAIIGVIVEVNELKVTTARVDIQVEAQFGTEETINGLHIHMGAIGENGPIVIDLNFGDEQKVPAGEVSFYRASDVLTDTDTLKTVEEILANPANFYVNLHTVSNPSGLIRGQLARTPNERFDALEEKIDEVREGQEKLDEALDELKQLKRELRRLKRKIDRLLR